MSNCDARFNSSLHVRASPTETETLALQTDTEQWFFSQSISSHHLCKNIFASICFSAESPLAYKTWHTNILSRCLSAYKICGQDKYLHFDFLWFWADVDWSRYAVTRYNVGVNTGHASLGLNCSAEACTLHSGSRGEEGGGRIASRVVEFSNFDINMYYAAILTIFIDAYLKAL